MDSKRALIVDDEPDIRELLEITLGRMKIETAAAKDLESAYQLVDNESFDLCLTDMQLPDGNGIELVNHISENYPQLPVAVITAFGSMDAAISALKAGAFDFVQKPVDLEQLRLLVDTALKLSPISDEAGSPSATRMLGGSPAMEELRTHIRKLARSQAPIYISGESGSGKEVAARMIHELGPRNEAPFIPVNCGAIPTELMESEFFGHVKGSFTGAVGDKEGLFQAAEGGTLFLDEVADLPLSMQVKLLRAIQEKAIRPVGAAQEAAIDVRILSATHKDLAEQVDNDDFRQDLYYRLNVIELHMPALRERQADIPELSEYLLERLAKDYQSTRPTVDENAMQALCNYDFPGNVRELENILERAFTLCDGDHITAADLRLNAELKPAESTGETAQKPPATNGAAESETVTANAADATAHQLADGESLEEYLEKIERTLITAALESTRWNKTAAAKELGITFRALRYRLKKLDLE